MQNHYHHHHHFSSSSRNLYTRLPCNTCDWLKSLMRAPDSPGRDVSTCQLGQKLDKCVKWICTCLGHLDEESARWGRDVIIGVDSPQDHKEQVSAEGHFAKVISHCGRGWETPIEFHIFLQYLLNIYWHFSVFLLRLNTLFFPTGTHQCSVQPMYNRLRPQPPSPPGIPTGVCLWLWRAGDDVRNVTPPSASRWWELTPATSSSVGM